MLIKRSTVQLLRFPFSFFLMPVFWFALSNTDHIDLFKAILIFCIIHLLVYPSSNGYNSYMDRDTESIGGIEHPMKPEKELFYITVVMDTIAVQLSLLVSFLFTVSLACYIICSRLYSYRGVRLKKYPIIGYLTVVLNQGGLLYWMVSAGAGSDTTIHVLPVSAACFLIGGFYPITQVYQHVQDRKDGVTTLSMLLGKKGTFIFCAAMYFVAFFLLFLYYRQENRLLWFGILQIFFLPVLVYFINWVYKVWRDETLANFFYTMRMNWIASTCTNLGFITLLMMHYFG